MFRCFFWNFFNSLLIKRYGKNEDIYFLTEENKCLDIVIQNIYEIENEYKKAMFLWAIYQATLSKRSYNLFHRKNLNLRTSKVKRKFGNKTTWDKPFEEHFKNFINQINNAIFNNNQNNKAFNLDVFDLDIKVDLIYIDPPYIPQKGSLIYYRDFYHFLEGITDYNNWFKNIDYKSKNKKLLSKYNIWEDKVNINKAFKDLICKKLINLLINQKVIFGSILKVTIFFKFI